MKSLCLVQFFVYSLTICAISTRNGCPTPADIDKLNECCLYDPRGAPLQSHLRYACHLNRDRDAINCATFERRCIATATPHEGQLRVTDSVIVLADDIRLGDNSRYLSTALCNRLYETCGEDNIKMRNSRMDPVLRLYPNCPVMMTDNKDVENGEANGTPALVKKVLLKFGETARWIPVKMEESTIWIQTVRASQVKEIQLHHCNDKIKPPTFSLEPKEFSFEVSLKPPCILQIQPTVTTTMKLKALQLPVIRNTATTGHKLQGASLDHLFVHNWEYRCPNWIYVVLSRVRTMKGLTFRTPLKYSKETFQLSQDYTAFLKNFAKKCPTFYTDNMDNIDLLKVFNYTETTPAPSTPS